MGGGVENERGGGLKRKRRVVHYGTVLSTGTGSSGN